MASFEPEIHFLNFILSGVTYVYFQVVHISILSSDILTAEEKIMIAKCHEEIRAKNKFGYV